MTSSYDTYPQYTPTITLLDLPRELRDFIWDFTFRGGGEVQFREGRLSFSVQYKIQQDDELDEADIHAEESGDEILDANTLLPILSDEDEDDGDNLESPTGEGEEDTVSNSASLSSISDLNEEDEEEANELSEFSQQSLIYPPPADFRWLLTNRQVLAEAVERFYWHAHCTSYYWDYSHNTYLQRYLAKKEKIHYPVSVFTFAKITSISLSLRLGTEPDVTDGNWYERLIPERSRDNSTADDDLRDIIRHIQTLQLTSLTHLNLGVWIFQTEAVSQDSDSNGDDVILEDAHMCLSGYQDLQGYEVDLSFLTGLGTRFKHIEMILFPTYMRAAYDDYGVEGSFVVVPMLQKELARVAKIMVGNYGWIVRDWVLKEIAGEPWRLDVTRGVEGQQEGTLDHIGFKTWPGQDFDGDNDRFHLQEDEGDGVMRWWGSYSDHEIAIKVPTIIEELGDHLFQRTSVSIEDDQ